MPVSSIGTLGLKYDKKTIRTNLTSPDTITLHQNLEKLKKKKFLNCHVCNSSNVEKTLKLVILFIFLFALYSE